MKRLLSLIVAVAFALSFAAVVVAAEKPAAAPAAAPAKAEPAKKVAKPKSKQITGTVESLDAAAGTFSVKGKKETVSLKAGEKVKLADFAVGNKVLVSYAEGTASSVKKVAEKKKAAPKAEKKDAAPAPKKEAAPAAPAK
jgi:hypothetical protein